MAKQRIIPIVYKVDYSQVDKSTQSVKKAEQATDKLNKEIKETETIGVKSFGALKNAIIATGVIGIVGTLAKKVFDLGVAQEQTTIAFNTFLGSAEKGKKLLAELTKFSIVTPFSPDQVNKAAKALLAFGVEGSKVIPTLKLLGDVSSGTGKDLAEMAVIFGQIRSTGRLMGQDLLQLINAGFNPLQIISQKTGKSVGDLKAEMEKGLITFEMVEGAFKDATSEGGLFFDLMAKQSETVGGKLSTIEGNIEEIGKAAFSASSGGLKAFVDILEKITFSLAETRQQSAERLFGIDLDKLQTIVGVSEDMIDNLVNDERWRNFLIGIDSQYKGLVEDIQKTGKVSLEDVRARVAFQAQSNGVTLTANDLQKISINLAQQAVTASNDLTEERNKETLALSLAREEQLKKVVTDAQEAKQMADLKEAQKKLNEEREKAERLAKKRTADLEKQSELLAAESEKEDKGGRDPFFILIEEGLKNHEDKMDSIQKDADDREYEKAIEQANRLLELEKEKNAEIKRLKAELSEALINYGTEVLVDALVGRELDFSDQEAKYEQELELAGDNEEAKKQIKKRQEAERQQFEKAQKEQQKKEAKARIGIDTAVAIIKTFAQFGYPAGLVPAALMAATGVVQAAIVNKYKDGVIDLNGPGTGTSDSIPAMLSRGESVMTAKETDSSMGILKAIRAKKLDDSKLEKLYHKKAGGDGVAFSDKRIVEAIKGQKQPDYTKIGSYLYEVKSKNRDHKSFIRKKYIS